MDFLIATHNMKKRAELERILKPIGVRVLLAEEAGVELTDVEETGVTFEENAFLKADSGCKESGMPCIADDSGLAVDALDARRECIPQDTRASTETTRRTTSFCSRICPIFLWTSAPRGSFRPSAAVSRTAGT